MGLVNSAAPGAQTASARARAHLFGLAGRAPAKRQPRAHAGKRLLQRPPPCERAVRGCVSFSTGSAACAARGMGRAERARGVSEATHPGTLQVRSGREHLCGLARRARLVLHRAARPRPAGGDASRPPTRRREGRTPGSNYHARYEIGSCSRSVHSAAVRVQGHQESPVTRDMPLFAIVPLGALGMVRGPHTLTMRGVRLRA